MKGMQERGLPSKDAGGPWKLKNADSLTRVSRGASPQESFSPIRFTSDFWLLCKKKCIFF